MVKFIVELLKQTFFKDHYKNGIYLCLTQANVSFNDERFSNDFRSGVFFAGFVPEHASDAEDLRSCESRVIVLLWGEKVFKI